MADQKYFLAGIDLSALTSASQEQLMQAINGLEPLDNIGVVVVGTVRPDITNNPEMINSLWLDTTSASNPVLKRYIASRTVLVDADVSWEAVAIADSSITTAMITARSSTGGVNIAKLKVNSDYSAGSSYYILRTSSDGKYIEAVSLDTALNDGGGVGFNRISTTGIGTGKFLKTVAGALAYGYIDPATDINSTNSNRIPVPTCLSPGTSLYLVRTNSAGTAVEWVAPTDATLLFNLAQLNAGGAAINDTIRFDGTNWVKVTPTLRLVASDAINSGTVYGSNLSIAAGVNLAHGLTTVPKIIRVVAVCLSTDLSYAAGDEVELHYLEDTTNAPQCAFRVCADISNITFVPRSDYTTSNIRLVAKTGAAGPSNIDKTKWQLKAYAWK